MFDLSARAEGSMLTIEVIDSLGTVFHYPVIIDGIDPLMTGSVGLQTWGTDTVYYTGYGGQSGPLWSRFPSLQRLFSGWLQHSLE
jgi:hypothetical protein